MLGGIVFFFVYSKDYGEVFVFSGCGDDDFFHAAAQMLFGVVGIGEVAGRLDDDLRSDGIPGQSGGIFFFEDFYDFAIDRNAVGSGGDFIGQVAEDGIVLEQVGERLGIGEIVDGDEVEVLVRERGAKNVASDASKSINADFYGHAASERNFTCLRKCAGSKSKLRW